MRTFLCVSRGAGLFGWLIRKVTGADVNHAFIMYKSQYWGGWFAVDIREDGPYPVPAKKAFKQCSFVEMYEPAYDLREGILQNQNSIGKGYDWLGILGAFLAFVRSKVTGRRVRNTLHSSGRNFCSEYVANCEKKSSGSDAQQLDPASTYPGDLASRWRTNSLVYRRVDLGEMLDLGVPLSKKIIKEYGKQYSLLG